MKLHGHVSVNAPQEKVWELFMDPLQLATIVPGCEQARQLDDTHYEAMMAVKVQFMTIRSKARGALLETEAPRHLTAEMTGEPIMMAGAFRARLSLELVPDGDDTTVHYSMDLTLLGRLASLGEAIVRSTAQHLTAQFSENISKRFRTSERS